MYWILIYYNKHKKKNKGIIKFKKYTQTHTIQIPEIQEISETVINYIITGSKKNPTIND